MAQGFEFRRRELLLAGLGLAASPARADKRAVPTVLESLGGVTISLRDLAPRFLDFYRAAQGVDPERRFALWKALYDFAAVPPTPEGDKVARRLLDAAWPRYASALPVIETGAAGMRPRPLAVADRVADALSAPRPLKIGVVAYVGAFETNAFTNGTADGPVVAVPIEMDVATRTLILPHEMTHAVHILTAGLSAGYTRTLGRVVFEEGLAMRTTQRLEPGRPDFAYVGEKAWFDRAMAERRRIFEAIVPNLDAKDGDTLFRFTMGQGATGIEREAYVAGWVALGRLLETGRTLADLARIPEAQMPDLIARTLRDAGSTAPMRGQPAG